jgi:hypothetical protein
LALFLSIIFTFSRPLNLKNLFCFNKFASTVISVINGKELPVPVVPLYPKKVVGFERITPSISS